MVEELLDDTKFIVVPRQLANQLRLVAMRLGTSVSGFSVEALTQALRIHEMGADLKEAVDIYHLSDVQRGAGNVQVTRSVFRDLILRLYEEDRDELLRVWGDHGRWYGAYLKAKLSRDEVLGFLEKDLLVSWNLDEAEITRRDLMVTIRLVSFGMSEEFTELLVSYVLGLMGELGFSESERDVLRGLVFMRLLGKLD